MRYIGGKYRQRKTFIPAILETLEGRETSGTYIEPFIGGGWMFEKMRGHFDRPRASDSHLDLILMYRHIASGGVLPNSISEHQYQELRHAEPSAIRGLVGFGASFGGKWFGGFARGKSDFLNIALRHSQQVVGSLGADAFDHRSYEEWEPTAGDVVYCDPPYSNVGAGYASTSHGFDHGAFWETMDAWVSAGALVFVSEYVAPGHWLPIATHECRRTLSANSPVTARVQEMQVDRLFVHGAMFEDLI